MTSHRYAVILAGGSGTRFWPESRKRRPKQVLPITGKKPMIVETAARLAGLVPPSRILVVTHEEQAVTIRKLLPKLPKQNILAEPQAKNTAASIGWAASWIEDSPESVLFVLPADHAIADAERFRADLRAAGEAAQAGGLFTFGIRPSFPATGYGYLERGAASARPGGKPVHRVARFTEKPPRAEAERFLASGNYFWNSGMFVWRKDAILAAVETHLPDLHAALGRLSAMRGKKNYPATLRREYARLASISVDYGIMEKAREVFMLEAGFPWSDVGSWLALYELRRREGESNVAAFPGGGDFLARDCRGVLAFSEEKHLVAGIGVENLVIVHTADATLVCRRDRAEEVKHIVEELQRRKRKDLL